MCKKIKGWIATLCVLFCMSGAGLSAGTFEYVQPFSLNPVNEGVELGNTQLYQDTIKNSAAKSPKEFIDDVVQLVETYNGGKKLRDDVTMMVAKVER